MIHHITSYKKPNHRTFLFTVMFQWCYIVSAYFDGFQTVASPSSCPIFFTTCVIHSSLLSRNYQTLLELSVEGSVRSYSIMSVTSKSFLKGDKANCYDGLYIRRCNMYSKQTFASHLTSFIISLYLSPVK